MNPQYIDIIIFGVIAVFFIFKLVKSLGTRPDGREDFSSDEDISVNNNDKGKGTIIDMTSEFRENREENFKKGMDTSSLLAADVENSDEKDRLKTVFYKIYSIDNDFHPDRFLDSAKSAFEMIIEAFSEDDEDTLRALVDDKVFTRFKKVLDDYKNKKEHLEQTLIGFKEAKIEDASIEGSNAKIVVRFETEQAKVVKNESGEVVEGDSVMISVVKDVWTFARNLKEDSPDWTLVSVKGG